VSEGPETPAPADPKARIVGLTLDEHSVVRRSSDVEHERAVAVFDLLEENVFRHLGGIEGPFHLQLSVEENRLIFDVQTPERQPLDRITLPLSGFRTIVRDYFMVCESYFQAIRKSSPSQIEAIDMGRRGLHNEGSQLLRERLADRVEIDHNTARRLFTLICVLHIRG
jgi:uncharacterized protein (UPF0262 family)